MPALKPAAIAGVSIAVVIMSWPAFYNGQAFFFPDTTAYIRGADAAVQRLTGISSPWTLSDSDHSPSAPSSVSSTRDKSVLAGRSIYYGALLYAADRVGGISLAVGLQSLVLVLALLATLKALGLECWPYALPLSALIAALTAAPLYTAFLMPDIFAGLAILSCGVLMTCSLRTQKVQAGFWFALLALALTFHSTHFMVALAMFGAGAILHFWRRRSVEMRGMAVIGMALAVAFACGAAFTLGVTRLVGEPPLSPPFLMARMVADGPGYRYLVDTCPQNGFIVCDFIDRLPLASDDFLWREDSNHGVFAASSPAVRRALSNEQYRFALAVIAYDPWGEAKALARNAMTQGVLLGVEDFNYPPERKASFAIKLPGAYFEAMRGTPAYAGTMPIHLLSAISFISTTVGFAALVYMLISGRDRRTERSVRVTRLAWLIVFGVVVNAAICGALSGPHDRYESRLAWLIPAVALLVHFEIYRGWWTRRLRPLLAART
jgi:hypothetical protein